MSDPEPRGYMRRHPALTFLMVVVGLILLLPGICAIVFMASMGSDDPTIVGLWVVCVLIALGGGFLLVSAFR